MRQTKEINDFFVIITLQYHLIFIHQHHVETKRKRTRIKLNLYIGSKLEVRR
jgi:hypothetical protein